MPQQKPKTRIIGWVVLVIIASIAVGYAYLKWLAPQEQVTSAQPITKPTLTSASKKAQEFCPKAAALTKEKLLWKAPGGWRSYTASFANRIAGFSGAQWIGVNVGKIICLYQGVKVTSFPISLERDTLMRSPTDGKWGQDLGGYKVCRSTNRNDCPFSKTNINVKPPSMESIYKSLEK